METIRLKKILSLITMGLWAFVLLCGINVSASEVEKVSFSYCRSDNWSVFDGKTLFSDYMDCIKIQTDPDKDYYLSYKTWNEGKSGYYSAVKSNIASSDEYAGVSGRRIRNLSISVYDKKGNPIKEGIVVMYRAYVGGVWLPWVSNADIDWMSYVQRKYKLDGVLDTKSGNAGINTDYISGIEIHIFEEKSIDDEKGDLGKSQLINVPLISQIGSYPTGCESVSAVLALKHNGFDVSVDDFIDLYLPKGNVDSFDPNLCFGGNPRSSNGMGCYVPVIVDAANKVLEQAEKTAKQISNYSLEEICEEYIDNGVPVIVWATIDMQKATVGKKIIYDDRVIQWIAPEHCLLLVGYDENNYIFNDPQKPETVTYYPKNTSENAFCALGCQAAAIVNKPLPEECFSLSTKSYIYNGTVRTPTVTVKDTQGNILKKDIDYTIKYDSGKKNVGTYKVTVTMKGNYSGSKTLTFKINPIKVSSKFKFKLSATSYTYNCKVKSPSVTVKNANGTTLTKNTHYTVSYASGRKNVGTYKVTIKMKGNYIGTKTLTFKINPPKTTVSKVTAGKKSLKVYVSKKSTQVTGYQIYCSTSKSFSSKVTKKYITSYKTTSTTLSGLSAKKTYYVKVRTYKTVNGTKYYSGWSTVKTQKTK